MRRNIKFESLREREGEERTVNKFLWFPMWIGDQIRWMEKASIVQEVVGSSKIPGGPNHRFKWENVRWKD